jgi:hypothetical protein
MKVFFASYKRPTPLRKYFKEIIDTVEELGHVVLENQFTDRVLGKYGKIAPQKVLERDEKAFKESDIFVAEITKGGFSEGYYYSKAQIQNKPALILIKEKYFRKGILTDLIRGSSSENVSLEYYNEHNLKKILERHLSKPRSLVLTKFNFIISPYIADYLDWVGHVKKQSRSDFLREQVVKKVIEPDEEYQKYLTEQRKGL